MAKDGTNRGGRCVRAGAKPDPLKTSSKPANPPPVCSNPSTWTLSAWTVWTWVKALHSTGNYARTFRLSVRDTA